MCWVFAVPHDVLRHTLAGYHREAIHGTVCRSRSCQQCSTRRTTPVHGFKVRIAAHSLDIRLPNSGTSFVWHMFLRPLQSVNSRKIKQKPLSGVSQGTGASLAEKCHVCALACGISRRCAKQEGGARTQAATRIWHECHAKVFFTKRCRRLFSGQNESVGELPDRRMAASKQRRPHEISR